jgi:hypothetical protein
MTAVDHFRWWRFFADDDTKVSTGEKLAGAMKAVINRVHRLEVKANAYRDLELNPRKRLCIIVWRVGRDLDWATATCDRTLTADGYLSELVQVDGSPEQMTDRDYLEQFIASFAVRRLG